MRLRLGVLLLLSCALVLVAASISWARHGPTVVPIGGVMSAVVPDPSAPRVYAVDRDNSLALILRTDVTPTITARIPVGLHPSAAALDPDGATLYVAEEGSGTIGVIDLASAQRVGSINVGVPPQAIAAGRPGRLYVVGMDDEAFMTDDLRIFDTATGALLGTFFTDYFYQPSVAMDPDGNTLYVLTSGSGVVAVDVSTDTPSLGPSVYIPIYYRDLWVNWSGTRLYLGSGIYDLPSLTLAGQLPIGATTVATSASDEAIVSGNFFDPTMYLWRASDLDLRGTFLLQDSPYLIRVSPYDGVIISAQGTNLQFVVNHKVK